MINEQDIVKGCLREDRDCQRELYKRFSGKMMAVCMRYASNRMEAEDMLQEGFIKVFNQIKTFKGDGSLEGWIRKIIVNNNLNTIRKNKIIFENIDDNLISNINDEIIITIDEKILLDLISKLPQGYRSVFNMYVFEDYKHKEIASILGIDESTSRTQFAKAKKYLQKQIAKIDNQYIKLVS